MAGTPRKPAPMPEPPGNDVHRITIIGQLDLQMTVNTFFYRGNSVKGTATRNDLIALEVLFDDPANGVLPVYLDCLTTDYELARINVDCVTMPNLVGLVVTPATPLRGTEVPPTMPNHTAVTIHRLSQWRGKRGRGRISVPAVARASVVNNTLTAPLQHEGLKSAMAAILSDATHTFTPGILARKKDLDPSKPDILGWNDATSHVLMTTLGTCRRRKPGVGK